MAWWNWLFGGNAAERSMLGCEPNVAVPNKPSASESQNSQSTAQEGQPSNQITVEAPVKNLTMEEIMPDLITPETLSKETLKSIFDAALLETSYDSDGDLRVRDDLRCWVFPRDDRIRLAALFGFKSQASRLQRLEFVNRLNSNWIIVRATVGERNDNLWFDHDIPLRGGVPPITIVQATKRFLSIIGPAVRDCDTDNIVN